MTTPVCVRFAPSPSGRIHIGNARTALFNWLLAKRNRGRFILRFDDTDAQRSSLEYARAIELDLAWLGVVPDAIVRQSERFALYRAAAETLRRANRLYPCYETPEELDRKRALQAARGRPPVYDRAALRLSDSDRAALEAAGRKPHWRFLLDHRVVEWSDLARGHCHIDCASLSDPVLAREDGAWLYTLPSVVDDLDMNISHVVRGEDHVTNAAVQIQLFEALAPGRAPPVFAHHNLLTDASGEGLSKRKGALSIGALREAGLESLAVAAQATLTGTSIPVHAVGSLEELAALFDLSRLSRTPARFDMAELQALSLKTLHALSFESVRDRLAAHEITGRKAEAFWLSVRSNLTTFDEVVQWWRVVDGMIEPRIEDEALLAQALALLPREPWDEATWGLWTSELKQASGRKGRALFHPLRLALTGREQGPELASLMPLIGPLKTSARLCGRVA
ncbi:MAG TPA: glutamate--tRNA ligase [Beijerinckiaceae bacterium]|nr:glutamate--tRNA ligase [Beijerinckiaceae bacterium]